MIRLLNCTLLVVVLAGCGDGGGGGGPPAGTSGAFGPASAPAAKPAVAGPVVQLGADAVPALSRAYENEASGDATYTGRLVRFSWRPAGVDRLSDGRYRAWFSVVEGGQGKHIVCQFRPGQGESLATGGLPSSLRVQGRVVGRVGADSSSVGVRIPVVVLDDCEVVKP